MQKNLLYKGLFGCSDRGIPGVTSTNAIIYDHYLVTISCLVIEVLFAVTKKNIWS
jgi:hypothetical protein